MVSRADLDRLAELETQARLADAVIETTKVSDLPALDYSNMTVGEIITLANAVEAIRSITDAEDALSDAARLTAPAPESYPGGYATERRGGSPESSYDQAIRKMSKMVGDLIPPDYEVNTVGGPVKYRDIPKDRDGALLAGWLADNCTCESHENERIAKDQHSASGDDRIARGLYL